MGKPSKAPQTRELIHEAASKSATRACPQDPKTRVLLQGAAILDTRMAWQYLLFRYECVSCSGQNNCTYTMKLTHAF